MHRLNRLPKLTNKIMFRILEKKHIVQNALPPLEFGAKFKGFRKKYNLTFDDVADICGNVQFTSSSGLHRLENGKCKEYAYNQVIQTLEIYLSEWMESRRLPVSEIEETLTGLFPFRSKNMIQNRCELNAAAVKFFGLKADPFDVDRVPSDEEMFTNKELDDIAARVCDAVLYKRFIAVVGAIGTGKTSMKIRVARELAESKQRVHLLYPEFFDMNAVQVGSIASSILEEFDIKPPQSATIRVRRIKQLLTSLEQDDARIALIFDECHRLNEKVLISLKNFWEMTNGGYSRLLGIVLFGQTKFVDTTLRDVKFREIAERVQVVEMPSIEKSARDYLTHKIKAVGGDITELFEPRAIERICSVAKTPLSLGNVANSALMEAFKLEEKKVVSQMLKLPDVARVRNLRAA